MKLICDNCRKLFVRHIGISALSPSWCNEPTRAQLANPGVGLGETCAYCALYVDDGDGLEMMYRVQDRALVLYEIAVAVKETNALEHAMNIFEVPQDQRAELALRIARTLASKNDRMYGIRISTERDRYFIHPIWRTGKEMVERDHSYLPLGELIHCVYPSDVSVKQVAKKTAPKKEAVSILDVGRRAESTDLSQGV